MTSITICRDGFVVRKREDAGERWCFHDRKRLPHTWELMGPAPGVVTYWEPYWACRCTRCGEDHTRFPGT